MIRPHTAQTPQSPHTSILVIGAGYAGLLLTARLAGKAPRDTVSITLVSEADIFTERVRLHQFATSQTIQLRQIDEVLRGTGVRFVRGRVTSITPASHEITIEDQQQAQRLRYDYLVYALGSLTDRQRVPGVAEHAYTLAPRGPLSAAALRAVLPAVAARGGTVIVCGGGATGIETAAEFARSYPALRVRLVTQDAFGLFLGKRVARYMRRSLERLGVVILDQTTVEEVRADALVTGDGRTLPCDVCVWAGGFIAPPLAREAGLLVNERDQVVIDPFMRSLSHPAIYAVGDAAHPQEDPGVPVRMSAFTAAIMGAHGADCLAAVLRGKTPRPLSFSYVGQGIALGRGNAIGFNKYPDDRPNPPYITGWVAYQLRELFVRFLAATVRLEARWPGFFVWVGKRRYIPTERATSASDRSERVA